MNEWLHIERTPTRVVHYERSQRLSRARPAPSVARPLAALSAATVTKVDDERGAPGGAARDVHDAVRAVGEVRPHRPVEKVGPRGAARIRLTQQMWQALEAHVVGV